MISRRVFQGMPTWMRHGPSQYRQDQSFRDPEIRKKLSLEREPPAPTPIAWAGATANEFLAALGPGRSLMTLHERNKPFSGKSIARLRGAGQGHYDTFLTSPEMNCGRPSRSSTAIMTRRRSDKSSAHLHRHRTRCGGRQTRGPHGLHQPLAELLVREKQIMSLEDAVHR